MVEIKLFFFWWFSKGPWQFSGGAKFVQSTFVSSFMVFLMVSLWLCRCVVEACFGSS